MSVFSDALKCLRIPVAHLRKKHDPNVMLSHGTLQDMLEVAKNPNSTFVLNLLDCPMAGVQQGELPPRFRALASDAKALAETKAEPLISTDKFTDELFWATATTRGALSWIHVDDEGFAMVVQVMTGSKLWVVLRERRDRDPDFHDADMGSVDAYTKDWEPYSARAGEFEHEGVLLTSSSVL